MGLHDPIIDSHRGGAGGERGRGPAEEAPGGGEGDGGDEGDGAVDLD